MSAAASSEVSRHKCLIYNGHPSEQLPVVIPFLKDSLENNWRCLYLGSPEMVRMIDAALINEGIDPARETGRGSLVLSSARAVSTDGSFDPRGMVDELSSMADHAVRDGFQGLCATGDMLWELGNHENFDRLLEYEARLEQAFHGRSLRGICQYQRDLVPAKAVRDALATHRSAYIGGILNHDNLFYVPPELVLETGELNAAKQGEWMCRQIVRVLQAEQKRDTALQALQKSELRQRQLAQKLAEMNRNLEQRVNERTAELESANGQLETFSYSVSHDLNAPLQSILGFSEILKDQFGEALGEKGRQHLARVHTSALHMRELTEGLLALSGVVRTNLDCVPIDLTDLAEGVAREIRGTQPERAAEISVQPGLRAVGDRVLIRAVFANLLGNAWKFTSKRSKTQIEIGETTGESGEPVFFVGDNGAGFDARQAQKLFSPFERLHAQEEFPGTGIGLATVQRIITKHGGRIWAEGRSNEGATFFFTLPGETQSPRTIH